MREVGRVRSMGITLLLCVFAKVVQTATSADYGVPIEIKSWDTGRTPLAHMVDVTNGFGLRVLAEHNFLNENNIAFSPYGLMGILVALYEGVDGESSFQIQGGMQLPWNRNVMRVGFRDIHRTLKTYFVPEEGFLAGLALNNDNVTFNEGYKKILRFYGFDLDNDQLPTLAPNNATAGNSTTDPPMSTAVAGENTTAAGTTESLPAREDTSSTQAREEITPNPNAETINDVDIRGPTTTIPSSGPNIESTTEPMTPDVTDVITTVMTTTSAAIETQPTTGMTTTVTQDTTTMTTAMVSEDTAQPIMTSTTLTDESTLNNNEVDASTAPELSSTMAQTTQSGSSSNPDNTITTMSETQQTEDMTMSTADGTTLTTIPDMATTVVNESTLETLERKKKSIVDFIFTNPPYVDDYLIYRSYDVPIKSDIPIGGEQMFLVNGLRNMQVTYMHYDTVLEHAYLPHLEASALRLPLDSERYYLLVVLPSHGGVHALGRLLARMARESDLSDIYSALRPRRVRAIVPSFIVKGHVTLTTDLQKLGIRDVFEPRQRDFSPMTHQAGVYVRSIEQAVSVAIRKYRPDDNKNRYVMNRQPVTFSATYPFLYFVMDSTIHVALMAGKMADPLNTRIL